MAVDGRRSAEGDEGTSAEIPSVSAWQQRDVFRDLNRRQTSVLVDPWRCAPQAVKLGPVLVVAVDAAGAVSGIEILVCAEGYCGTTVPEWRAQFVGITHGKWEPSEAVTSISGLSLSSTHIAEGVKKILAVHSRYLPTAN